MKIDVWSISALRDCIGYDPQTGVWRSSTPIIGARHRGYQIIGFIISGRYKTVAAHRLAWAIHYGEWPSTNVDHVNCVKDDNRICNLRLATKAENGWNTPAPRRNKSGVKGVCWSEERQKWCAMISVNNKKIALGRFDTIDEAAAARAVAAERYHGEFARHK